MVATAAASGEDNSTSALRVTTEIVDIATMTGGGSGAVFKSRPEETGVGAVVETVQLMKVRFQIKKPVKFGETMRVVGSHESLGSWSLAKSLNLHWGDGDVWTSREVELPVDGVYIYKYVACSAANPTIPVEWQAGNNQVLTLSKDDDPLLWVYDNWMGDPSTSVTYRTDGTTVSKEDR